MKNAFKFGFLALAISLSVAACQSSEKTGESADTTLTDTSAVVTTVDTTVTDTAAKKDTVAKATTPEAKPAH
ncbi:MAG: hypothetical protein P0Y49_14530 [Candidatus Pedobacter colombiensis]|uniref:Entericidin n=1 Tax=Candidatus Pedobacter colombiensis TaxID=3121371 RepID=A0AAJ5W6G0_9SPHI|nr:hypothetical protein [Pedobacter sp.]WEK18010.1 MAG: hypothetical protein P0Y49_14530 [Pedobacter sp.]